MIMGNFI